ncbi:DUF6099 family protein [Streptomyces sp. NPDC058045]|uniref:DUF6099 family protein n=1 Tax=Streptomyces sp. NPDC058045 TaxID=3346311 RepID=UPI0036E0AD48
MDVMRLIDQSRHALEDRQEPVAVMTEAWQAQALAQAVGSRMAVGGPPELRGEAIGLSEIGVRGCGALGPPRLGREGIRAARLTRIGDARAALLDLSALLGEVGIALVGLACSAGADGVYWQCMEAIDAADESRDRILEMVRKLTDREAHLPEPDRAAGTS